MAAVILLCLCEIPFSMWVCELTCRPDELQYRLQRHPGQVIHNLLASLIQRELDIDEGLSRYWDG